MAAPQPPNPPPKKPVEAYYIRRRNGLYEVCTVRCDESHVVKVDEGDALTAALGHSLLKLRAMP
jgi:hypothetical protein